MYDFLTQAHTNIYEGVALLVVGLTHFQIKSKNTNIVDK